MPERNDAAARYRVALEQYLHDEREFAPSSCIDDGLNGSDLSIHDLAQAHAEALSTAIAHVPAGALSAVLLRSAVALATAVMAKSIWASEPGEAESRSAYSVIEHYVEYARSMCTPFCILLVDIDNLRRFNRAFGRKAGTEALYVVHGILRASCRTGDVVMRCGGDEFCVILPGVSLRGGMMAAERIRVAVEEQRLGQGCLTVSIGVVCWPGDGRTADHLMQLGYEACHMALSLGGNGIYTPLAAQSEDGASELGESEGNGDALQAEVSNGAEEVGIS